MREKTIRKLVKLVEEADIESLTVRNWWTKVQIIKKGGGGSNGNPHESTITIPRAALKPTLPPMEVAPTVQVALQPQPQSVSASATPAAATGKEIKSPMVGTFYKAPESGADPYVKVGGRVTPGQTVCIIEAMKIMNEIEAEISGVVREICADDTQPVEFGQVLFRVDPHG